MMFDVGLACKCWERGVTARGLMRESNFPQTRTVGALTSDTLIFKIKLLACRKLHFCYSYSVGAQQDLLSPPDSSFTYLI